MPRAALAGVLTPPVPLRRAPPPARRRPAQKFENAQRAQRGEPPLPLDDFQITLDQPEPSRIETLLVTRQIDAYCRQVNQFAGQAFSKLFLTSSLQ